MNLRTVLTQKTIALHLQGTTKEEIIRELLGILVQSGSVQSPEKAYESILERERKMSTGMKHGIAIPHGKTDTVSDLVACVGVSDNPVDFETLDGKPCRIFIMTLSPLTQTGPHLQFLAEVSLLFRSSEKREALLSASTPEEVLKILSE
jgi:mannitol/fructose-specific phosphotransferase system IIA component (Ntr-type)